MIDNLFKELFYLSITEDSAVGTLIYADKYVLRVPSLKIIKVIMNGDEKSDVSKQSTVSPKKNSTCDIIGLNVQYDRSADCSICSKTTIVRSTFHVGCGAIDCRQNFVALHHTSFIL